MHVVYVCARVYRCEFVVRKEKNKHIKWGEGRSQTKDNKARRFVYIHDPIMTYTNVVVTNINSTLFQNIYLQKRIR